MVDDERAGENVVREAEAGAWAGVVLLPHISGMKKFSRDYNQSFISHVSIIF